MNTFWNGNNFVYFLSINSKPVRVTKEERKFLNYFVSLKERFHFCSVTISRYFFFCFVISQANKSLRQAFSVLVSWLSVSSISIFWFIVVWGGKLEWKLFYVRTFHFHAKQELEACCRFLFCYSPPHRNHKTTRQWNVEQENNFHGNSNENFW